MATTTNNDIARAIYLSSKDGGHTPQFYKNVTQFLVRKRLLPKAKDILLHLNKIINEGEGRIEAKVSSKSELDGETKKELINSLSKRYSAKDVVLHTHLDERLLGGFRVEVDDEVIDLTIKNKIGKLQEHLTKNA